MDAYIQLATVFASGLFGLLVAVVTLALTGYKESRTERRTLIRDEKRQLEDVYARQIALFEKCIRYTNIPKPYEGLYDDLALVNARMRLLSTMGVIEQSERASDLLHRWSSEHRAGMPKPIGDTGAAVISSNDSTHQEQARELFPQLHDQINKMIEAMQTHLGSIGT